MPNLRPLHPALAKKAQDELFEVPERIDEDIAALKTWLSKQPHLKTRTDDQFLTMWLRGTKYSLERAKQKIDLYYTIRSTMKEIFEDRDPTNKILLEIIRKGVSLPLPLSDGPAGPRLFIFRPGICDPDQHKMLDIIKVNTMIIDILLLEDDNTVVAGQVGVCDLENCTMAHFLQFNPTFMKKMTMLNQEASPIRQKGFNYLNTPSFFETMFNMFKVFLNEKMLSRVKKIYILCYLK